MSQEGKGNLLVVDNDPTFLILAERLFGKHFVVKVALSSEKAFDVINKAFAPEVILCSNTLPGISGADLLERSIKYFPLAVRILITEDNSSQDLLESLNKSRSYMFISKPCSELEIIQAVRLAFDYYNSQSNSKEQLKQVAATNKELKETNEALKKYVFESRTLFNQTLNSLSTLIRLNEKMFFTSHTHDVALIAKTIAERMSLNQETVTNVVTSALLHNATTAGMPHKYITIDPFDLDEDNIIIYFDYFQKGLGALKKVGQLTRAIAIISQIWEHHDGTGFPYGLSGPHVLKEAQIIALASIYHNRVYRVPFNHLEKLMMDGELVQTRNETAERHNEALKFLYKKATWFDIDIFNEFQTIVKKKLCQALIPSEEDLLIKHPGMTPYTFSGAAQKKSDTEPASKGSEPNTVTGGKKESVEKEIPISMLEPGMVVAQNVVTKAGMTIVRHNTKLEANVVKNIKQLESSGLLGGTILVITEN